MDALEPAVEVDEGAVLLQPGGHWQYDVGVPGGLGQEQFVADDERAGVQGLGDPVGVGVGGAYVLADDPQRP